MPPNREKALEWYSKAAEQGHADAQVNLAVMYHNGYGKVLPNREKAFYWFSKAAEQGLAEAQFYLAVMYADGLGVAQSNIGAYKWFFIAKKNGDEEMQTMAQTALNKLSKEISKEEIVKAEALAERCIDSDYKDCDEDE